MHNLYHHHAPLCCIIILHSGVIVRAEDVIYMLHRPCLRIIDYLFPTSFFSPFFAMLDGCVSPFFFVCHPSGITNYTRCPAKLCWDWNFLSIIRSIRLTEKQVFSLVALFFSTDFFALAERLGIHGYWVSVPYILLYHTSFLYKFRSPCERQQIFVNRLHASSSNKEIQREENAKLSSNSTWHI
jgi:hypothetical protein